MYMYVCLYHLSLVCLYVGVSYVMLQGSYVMLQGKHVYVDLFTHKYTGI